MPQRGRSGGDMEGNIEVLAKKRGYCKCMQYMKETKLRKEKR